MSTEKLGQYFTISEELQNYVLSFIKNKPKIILEPSFGKGHLIIKILETFSNIKIKAYEIDKELKPLVNSKRISIFYGDFLKQKINNKFLTIIGNPPYVKTTTGNMYIKFVEKCVNCLAENGELIFIVPSDFLKITSAREVIKNMIENGSFTHIYFPHKENLFKEASIDVMIFRYQKDIKCSTVEINGQNLYTHFSEGIITFHDRPILVSKLIKDFFNVYVGLVSGKENVFKNKLGDTYILNDKNLIDKYILIKKFPCDNNDINDHLIKNKESLINRKIRKFSETNWFEWGALRNIKAIEQNVGKPCIYVTTLSRKDEIAFKGKVQLFGGKLICMIPKQKINLDEIVDFLNTNMFKENYTYSGRFKIGQKQLSNALLSPINFVNL